MEETTENQNEKPPTALEIIERIRAARESKPVVKKGCGDAGGCPNCSCGKKNA